MKKRTIMIPDETASALKAAADAAGAPSVGELLRLAALQPVALQRAYLDGMRTEIDARIARLDRRSAKPSASAAPPARRAPASPARTAGPGEAAGGAQPSAFRSSAGPGEASGG